jgi:hypothetical protein
MNSEARLELEQYFDGELGCDRQAEVARRIAADDEARAYLTRLARLRGLARSCEWSANQSAGLVLPHARSSLRLRRFAAVAPAALAAGIAAVILWRGQIGSDAPRKREPTATASASAQRPKTQDVALRRSTVRNQRRRAKSANLAHSAVVHPRKRPASLEVLALDLANAPPEQAQELKPLAMLRESAVNGRPRHERHPRHTRIATPGT